MDSISDMVVGGALAVVVVVLFVGIVSMIRGGDFDRRNANRLMRWRVIAQGAALALLAILFLVRH